MAALDFLGLPLPPKPAIKYSQADLRQGQLAREQAALIEKARQAYLDSKFIPKRFSKTPAQTEAYLRFIGIK